jgi:hypothetical protein
MKTRLLDSDTFSYLLRHFAQVPGLKLENWAGPSTS